MGLLSLKRGGQGALEIHPRWPARSVCIDAQALARIQAVQARLPSTVGLIVTRGYEDHSSRLGIARTVFRRAGIGLFTVLYPGRRREIDDIFGANGHDIDGTHIDVSIRFNGQGRRLLPFGVFTPLFLRDRRCDRDKALIAAVKAALEHGGFRVHRNLTESMQIHCDMI